MNNSILKALFLDVPSVIDSVWRHTEFALNRECTFRPGRAHPIAPRPCWQTMPFWLFAITVFFVSYGPTWGGLCAVAPRAVMEVLRNVAGIAIALGAIVVGVILTPRIAGVINRHFGRVGARDIPPVRPFTTYLVVFVLLFGLVAAGVSAGGYLRLPSERNGCGVENGSMLAAVRLALCLAAIIAFWAVMRRWPGRAARQVIAQAVIITLLAGVQWFLLAGPGVVEANDLPYRHVFLIWAPLILIVVALAPVIARRVLSRNIVEHQRQGLRSQMRQTELFPDTRTYPTLSYRRIGSAIVYGPAYHLKHLLLIPALVALVVDADSLYLWTGIAFAFSFLLLAWGNISDRWDQLNTYIERWFLRGVPLLVSSLVIVLAILRLARFGYISTLLDVIPLGMIFGLIAMTYVLFWLVEYWISRIAAVHLLGVLGRVGKSRWIRYPFAPVQGGVASPVSAGGRYIVSHGSGRLAVLGAHARENGQIATAFQTYSFTELFDTLRNQAGQGLDPEWINDIRERLGMYHFRLNALIVAVTVALAGIYWTKQSSTNAIEPVVEANASQSAAGYADLALLLKNETAPGRPAMVVIGSGGGTRAALYTATVLHGLYRLGVARDIVFESGVSGGGVALAYFAAHRDRLTVPGGTGAVGTCPDGDTPALSVDREWDCFMKRVTSPFIEDVLNGATEWRIFTTTALSQLLVDSFDRHLFARRPTLASVSTPLILNTAIVGHPSEESMTLTRTIDGATKCEDLEQPFRSMNGGRLIFTNLRDTNAFPVRGSEIPDVRLPYQIVTDGAVKLSQAAALNANFPPVFPNARVRLQGGADYRCPIRSYYVTDGGAQENLGLISALYGLESALKTLPTGTPLRPIHIVIAEASAVTFDYSQDRGISAPGGARERLSGGLTNALIERVKDEVARVTKGTHEDPDKEWLRFHFLGMPLAFRSRGGFGTHWLYAKAFDVADPRPRIPSSVSAALWPTDQRTEPPVRIGQADMEALWRGLHDPQTLFCDGAFKDPAKKVQAQICGDERDKPEGRDLHLGQWTRFVETMKTNYR